MTLRISAPLFAALAVAHPLAAQGCRVGKETNEARLLAYYAVPLVFSPSGSLGGLQRGGVRIGFDATLIPAPGDNLRQTRVCFLPKEENSQLSPVFPRPHVTLGLGAGLFVEAMYLPPLTVADATPNLGSIALGMARRFHGNLGYAFRAHATFGEIKGPITCNTSALQVTDQNKACYGTRESEDTYEPSIRGAEVALTFKGSGRPGGYAAAGVTSSKPRFQVGFTSQDGFVDSSVVTVGCDGNPSLPCASPASQKTLTRFALMVGGSYDISPRLAVTAELYSVPSDMTTIRMGGVMTLGSRK